MIMKETIEHISDNKIIMIVRGVPTDRLVPLGEAVWRGGIRVMECTYDASGIIPDEVIAEGIALLSKHFEGRMTIGAGTVLKKSQIALTKAAGGQFIVSPDTNEEIIKETKKAGLVSIPGALTPSEATTAHRAGADFVKLFPVSQMGGVSYVKTLCAPLSHIRFLAVGGVKAENVRDYIESGAYGVGIGLNDTDREAINKGDFDHIESKCRAFVSMCECKKK